ncbi:leucine-rich repeat protein [Mangrovibacterium sp.]|uniref:leucine-rich repeat protein n=1 Tax=Mangrovibacterium sp. TaxID=1961364 RepID=UPI00356A3012
MKKGKFNFPVIKIEGSGGGSSPDPAVYCPANGYIRDPEEWNPPIVVPEITTESLTFICDASKGDWDFYSRGWDLSINESETPNYLYEIFDENGTLVDSFYSQEDGVDYSFPDSTKIYTLRISLTNQTFYSFFYNSVSGTNDGCLLQVVINAPYLRSITFQGELNLNHIEFISDTSYLTSLGNLFRDCSNMQYFKMPVNLQRVHSMAAMALNSGLRVLDMRDCLFTFNQGYWLADNIVRNCKYLREIHFPEYFPASRVYYALQNTPRLEKVTMFSDHGGNMGDNNMLAYNYMFEKCAAEGEISVPSSGLSTMCQYMFQYSGFSKVTLFGDWSYIRYASGMFYYAEDLEEVIFPSKWQDLATSKTVQTVFNTSCKALKRIVQPDIGYVNLPSANSPLEEISGDADTSIYSTKPYVTCPTGTSVRANLHTFNMPKLQPRRLWIGGSSSSYKMTALTNVEVDWGSSGSWNYTHSSSPVIRIYAAIDATEINRIFTALRTVTDTKIIDVRYSDGYADCDPTIAEAKGWTVL